MKKFIILLLAALLIAGVFISCKQDPPTYTVSFNNNGGKGSMDSISGKAGTNVTIPAGTGDIYNQNYRFISWNTKEDGSGTEYESEDVIEKIQANLTLYAQWESLFEVLKGDDWSCETTAGDLEMDDPIPAAHVVNVSMTTEDDGSFSISFVDTDYEPSAITLAVAAGTYKFNAKSETDGVISGTLVYSTMQDPDAISGTLHIENDNKMKITVTEVGGTQKEIEIVLTRPEA